MQLRHWSRQFAVLLQAGIPIYQALTTMREGINQKPWRENLVKVEQALSAGQPFSRALSELPMAQHPMLIALVKAAEGVGDIGGAMMAFAQYEDKIAESRTKLTSSLIYPGLIFFVGLAVLGFLIFYILPKLAIVYAGIDRPLPWGTGLLMALNTWIASHVLTLLVGVIFVVCGLSFVLTNPSKWLEFRLLISGIFGIKQVLADYFVARFYLALGTLLTAGVPLQSAIEQSALTLPIPWTERIAVLQESLAAGLTLSDSLQQAHLMTPLSAPLLRSVEGLGQQAPTLLTVARLHEVAFWDSLDRTIKAIEPIVTLVIGLLVGTLVVLMYLPVFDLASAI